MDLCKDNADAISVDTLALEETLEEERLRELSKLKALGERVCNLHLNVLYYRNTSTERGAACYEAWKMLVRKIGGSPNTWREFGTALGVEQDDLNYIKNSVKDDPADIVIRVYMQDESATLDKVTDALVKINRYDILKAIEEPFCNLSQYFNIKDDSGYHSESKVSGNKKIFFTNDIANDLPAALIKNYVVNEKDETPFPPPPPPPLPSALLPTSEMKKVEDDRQILFLTYTEDGLDTAINIQHCIHSWDEPKVTVITLSNKKKQVYQNPEKFIREYFQKAAFVVPIITAGYLERITPDSSPPPTTNDNLDYKYVNFIYTLISNYYIHASGCLNTKVRSVLPYGVNLAVLKKMTMYPELQPYTYESNFNEYFKAFLKKGLK